MLNRQPAILDTAAFCKVAGMTIIDACYATWLLPLHQPFLHPPVLIVRHGRTKSMKLSHFGIFFPPFGTEPFVSSFFLSSGPKGTPTGSGSLLSINSADNGALYPDTV